MTLIQSRTSLICLKSKGNGGYFEVLIVVKEDGLLVLITSLASVMNLLKKMATGLTILPTVVVLITPVLHQ